MSGKVMAGLAVLVLSACGSSSTVGGGAESSSSSSSQAGPNDPCRFVTKDEAAAIFGEAASTTVNPAGACEYTTPSGKKVSVFVPPVRDAGQAYTSGHVTGVTDVSGLGDRAFCRPPAGASSAAIWVQKGNVLVEAEGENCATDQKFEAKALARV